MTEQRTENPRVIPDVDGGCGNNTQFQVTIAAQLAGSDWVAEGARTLERLHQLADAYALKKNLPAVMVRSHALNILRDRVPDCLPKEMLT